MLQHDFFRENQSVEIFSQKLISENLQNSLAFNRTGKFTFFIPVDSAFKDLQSLFVDDEVVKAHMVPNQVMFTKPRRQRHEPVASVQHDDKMSLSVMIKMLGEAEDTVVQSITMVGNTRHRRGVVSARVVLGDIVTDLGVIHLIDTPLVIMTQTLAELLSSHNHNLRYKSFFSQISSHPHIIKRINDAHNATLLVPTNAAIESLEVDLSDNILEAHILDRLILENEIEQSNETNVSQSLKSRNLILMSSHFSACLLDFALS